MTPFFFLLFMATAALKLAPEPEIFIVEDGDEARGGGVRFTRPDGTSIYINPHAVAYVRAPLPGEHGHSTIVFSSGAKQQVDETVEEVISGIHIREPGEK
jgi:uncharacterized protein YlzI (FlbEa/FlbD family)